MFQGHVEFSFDSHNKVVLGGLPKKFSLSFRNFQENFEFCSEKWFSSKCSYGNIEGSFGNSAEIFPTKGRIFLVQRWNMSRRTRYFQIDIMCFQGHEECGFGNTAKKNSITGQMTLAQNPKTNKRIYLFSKNNHFLLLVHLNTWNVALRTPERISRQMAGKMYLEVRMSWRDHYNFKKLFSSNWSHGRVIGSVDSSTSFSRQGLEVSLVNFRNC